VKLEATTSNLRACVTGATGLIGSALVRRLASAGAEVRALVRAPQKASGVAAENVRLIVGDVTTGAGISEAIDGADVVFHLAAKVNSSASLGEFVATNVRGTGRVLQAAAASTSKPRVIYVSSIAVYGRINPGDRIDESAPLDPAPEKRDAYSHSKILAEQAVTAFAHHNKLPYTILRPGIVYGPAHPPPAGLVSFRAGRTHFVFGAPEWHVPLTYVENVVDALLAAAEQQPATAGPTDYNLIDDDALTLGAFHVARNQVEHTRTIFLSPGPVLASAALFGPLARAITPAASGFSTYQFARSLQDRPYDTSKIRAALGWSPRTSLRAALESSL
jgi:nucleoside-diphosphate-sugar epimerase